MSVRHLGAELWRFNFFGFCHPCTCLALQGASVKPVALHLEAGKCISPNLIQPIKSLETIGVLGFWGIDS